MGWGGDGMALNIVILAENPFMCQGFGVSDIEMHLNYCQYKKTDSINCCNNIDLQFFFLFLIVSSFPDNQ